MLLPLAASDRGCGYRLIRDGDLVIVYESHKCMKPVTVKKGAEFQSRYGLFRHDDWIGKPFGCKVVAIKKGGFVHLLAPTPQLWTLVLTHRTQILYVADISFVLAYLEVRPGCVVFESGTGSGSLTAALARALAPTGHVHSFDFHEQRAEAARKDFERNGLSSLVTVGVRDIQGEGFPPEFAGQVDAVFLDLPQPWTAITSVVELLRGDAPFCSFSPCIEQVQKTCEALTRPEFRDIRTFEVLLRTFEVHEESFGTSLGSGGATNSSHNAPPSKRVCAVDERKVDSVTENAAFSGEDRVKDCVNEKGSRFVSASLTVPSCQGLSESEEVKADLLDLEVKVKQKFANSRVKKGRGREEPVASKSLIVARPESEMKGHTGYLTFARRTV